MADESGQHPPTTVSGGDPAPTEKTIDKQTETVDLPGMGVIAQENVGPESEGGGEWPDPHTPPRGPSPG